MRSLAYLGVVLIALLVLRELPFVGGLFRIPLFGFLMAVAVVGVAAERAGRALVARQRFRSAVRALGHVDTPHNQGKLGSLLLAADRPRAAIEPLRAAVAGEPESAEWRYRLGCALLAVGEAQPATEVLEGAVGLEEDHAYGAALLRLAEARRAAGDGQGALDALDRHDHGHGPSPESALVRGLVLRALGDRDEARQALAQVGRLAREAPRYQRGATRALVLRAWLARLVG